MKKINENLQSEYILQKDALILRKTMMNIDKKKYRSKLFQHII